MNYARLAVVSADVVIDENLKLPIESYDRVYAAYGGVFIVLSILWGWRIDKIAPDRFDLR